MNDGRKEINKIVFMCFKILLFYAQLIVQCCCLCSGRKIGFLVYHCGHSLFWLFVFVGFTESSEEFASAGPQTVSIFQESSSSLVHIKDNSLKSHEKDTPCTHVRFAVPSDFAWSEEEDIYEQGDEEIYTVSTSGSDVDFAIVDSSNILAVIEEEAATDEDQDLIPIDDIPVTKDIEEVTIQLNLPESSLNLGNTGGKYCNILDNLEQISNNIVSVSSSSSIMALRESKVPLIAITPDDEERDIVITPGLCSPVASETLTDIEDLVSEADEASKKMIPKSDPETLILTEAESLTGSDEEYENITPASPLPVDNYSDCHDSTQECIKIDNLYGNENAESTSTSCFLSGRGDVVNSGEVTLTDIEDLALSGLDDPVSDSEMLLDKLDHIDGLVDEGGVVKIEDTLKKYLECCPSPCITPEPFQTAQNIYLDSHSKEKRVKVTSKPFSYSKRKTKSLKDSLSGSFNVFHTESDEEAEKEHRNSGQRRRRAKSPTHKFQRIVVTDTEDVEISDEDSSEDCADSRVPELTQYLIMISDHSSTIQKEIMEKSVEEYDEEKLTLLNDDISSEHELLVDRDADGILTEVEDYDLVDDETFPEHCKEPPSPLTELEGYCCSVVETHKIKQKKSTKVRSTSQAAGISSQSQTDDEENRDFNEELGNRIVQERRGGNMKSLTDKIVLSDDSDEDANSKRKKSSSNDIVQDMSEELLSSSSSEVEVYNKDYSGNHLMNNVRETLTDIEDIDTIKQYITLSTTSNHQVEDDKKVPLSKYASEAKEKNNQIKQISHSEEHFTSTHHLHNTNKFEKSYNFNKNNYLQLPSEVETLIELHTDTEDLIIESSKTVRKRRGRSKGFLKSKLQSGISPEKCDATDIEEIEVSDQEGITGGTILAENSLSSQLNVNYESKTDVEDMELSADEEIHLNPERPLSITPDVVKNADFETVVAREQFGSSLNEPHKYLLHVAVATQKFENFLIESPSPDIYQSPPTDTEDIITSADEDIAYSRAETATPMEVGLEMDEQASSFIHMKHTRKFDIESPEEILHIKNNKDFRDTHTDVEELGFSEEEYHRKCGNLQDQIAVQDGDKEVCICFSSDKRGVYEDGGVCICVGKPHGELSVVWHNGSSASTSHHPGWNASEGTEEWTAVSQEQHEQIDVKAEEEEDNRSQLSHGTASSTLQTTDTRVVSGDSTTMTTTTSTTTTTTVLPQDMEKEKGDPEKLPEKK